jgi:eukaryotic-like serine/threonine-protein kinase
MSLGVTSTAAGNERLDRYEILGELAQGGMAEILLGRLVGPSGFERVVVIKRILPQLAREKAFVEMFLDEARTVARLRHPNVVQVYELGGEVPSPEETGNGSGAGAPGRALYLVMEYLEGESVSGMLRRLSARKERLDPWLAAHVVAEACRGLHAAHELTDGEYPLDLVHRDVSPQNLFVTYTGSVKVLDFGIAKAADRTSRTEAGQVKGKLLYMSPEQCEGKALDRRSDVFALGAVLHELLTGRSLFRRGTPLATLKAICEQDAPPPSTFPGVGPRVRVFDEVCARALARRRDERYLTAAELRRDLVAAMRLIERPERPEEPEEQLGQLMHEIFGPRIEEKREMLRKARSLSIVTHIPIAEADEATDSFAGSNADADEPVQIDNQIDHVLASAVAATPEPPLPALSRADAVVPPGKRGAGGKTLAGLSVVAGVCVALGAVAVARSSSSSAAQASTTAAAPGGTAPSSGALIGSVASRTDSATGVAPAGAASTLPSAAATTVRLQIETVPPGAHVFLDGRDLGRTPLDAPLPPGSAPLPLSLRLPGYLPLATSATPRSDLRLVLTLVPLPRPSRAPEGTRSRPVSRSAPAIEKLP